MPAEESPQLQMPPSAQKPANPEPVIHVMPAEFRGGKMPLPPVQPPAAKPTPPPPPPPPKKPAPSASPKPGQKKRRLSKAVIIGGIIFLLIIAGGSWYLLSTLQAPEEEVIVTPEPEEEEEPAEEEPTEPEEEIAAEPTPGTDSDSDGLSDIEEVLFGSDPRHPDTDRDSYLDGNEVFHLYNPRGEAPSLLVDTGFAREFAQTGFSYTIVYPSRWTAQIIGTESESVMFRVPTGEFIQVLKQSKEADQSITEWYLSQSPEADEQDIEEVSTRQGYSGIVSPDKLTTYLDFGDTVYVVSYNLGEVETIDFLTTYQMMVNSFVLKKQT